MISVHVDAELEQTEGMFGIHGKPGMIGRDRETVLEHPNEVEQQ
jgi:hypothetical protein